MNPDIKQLWTQWLRDPANLQGKYRLERQMADQTERCCLGGLCHIASQNGVPLTIKKEETSIGSIVQYNGYDISLPGSVMEWAGIEDASGLFKIVVGNDMLASSLTVLNDSGFTFAQIADIIDYFF